MKIKLLNLLLVFTIFSCTSKQDKKIVEEIIEIEEISTYVNDSINFQENSVPKGPKPDATKLELYRLAWQQFIALNWPVNTNISGNRAKPNTSSDFTFLKVTPALLPTLVWNTYASKAEVFNHQSDSLPLWSSLSKPIYQYTNQPKPLNKGDKFDLFNNLDENNEIGEAVVFGGAGKGNTSGGNQVLYEAKINEAEYSYLQKYNLQNTITAKNWATETKKKLDSFGGTCLSEEAAAKEIICFPCADENNEGAIEIKAAWRKLNKNDSLKRYYVQNVLVYKKVGDSIKYTNQEYGLIGLHIIRKTKNYPTFIFTTFNHVDNLDAGIYYNNSIALEGHKPPYYQYYKKNSHKKSVPDTTFNPEHKYIQLGNIAVETQEEVHKIPFELQIFNTAVQNRIKTESNNKSVWQYYELLGVQAVPIDITNASTDESYYLANDVIETDYTLRRFTGAFGNPGILLNAQNINKKGKKVSMGGCMGCHGNAQAFGNDFSFLLGIKEINEPDTLGVPPDVLRKIKQFLKNQ